ncbi:protein DETOXIFICATION 45, chloroplastic isoform X1 [Cynara cardunculus var. scolymus]|uniref:protein DETOXIFICATION 45, chloroplastic isoform X1 n=2 Tax=Cynara cardunculus var. scolymus TaxID=59895 RepID=UPI000D62A493|nr:protein DETOXIFICATION 45, chloroplastic isoform X1 [Cynara cardunculus var. scolymus]XP_024992133.1 protein DETOXIFICATION 45, chloroplastic isoform X1 [Cynara cardunculus var. scolymus]XP_024992134.1 protein DETOXIFICATION 45, chloroplastic isoform X1 [Cynara cardunculus var. scolymus]XP_024992135.1 protein DETOXIFICATION 45, chloroplastic isoform X1 [Cynara cardunculus var. scolymus]
MASCKLNDAAVYNGLATESGEWAKTKLKKGSFPEQLSVQVRDSFRSNNSKRLRYADVVGHCCPVSSKMMLYSSVIRKRRRISSAVQHLINSDCSVRSSELEESFVTEEENDVSNTRQVYPDLMDIGSTEEPEMIENSRSQNIKRELVALSLPALAGQAIEPMALLMETAYIGRLGPVQLASAGVSISIFNIVSKLFNIPLLSVATSFVAEDIAKNSLRSSSQEENSEEANGNGKAFVDIAERKQLASVSTALLLAVGIGIFEGLALYFGSGVFLNLMGISSGSSMHALAQQFLSLRALGAPAVVVSLALQGVFRGFKDTRTPVLCLGIGNCLAIFLFPLLMYYFKLGVTGAAISTVISQYMITFLLIWHLNKRAVLLPPRLGALQFGGYMKSGGFLLGRTLAVLTTTTLGTSMAARQGPIAMAAHQICLQVWLAVSLITDALAASGQALIASSVSKGDYRSVKDITHFVLKIGFVTGVSLAAILGISFGSIATLFTKDVEVLRIARTGVLFVSASQPLNALAFIVDGLHYGVSDFPYAAYSMMSVGILSSAFLFYVPSTFGLYGVWSGLTLFMGLRMVAGFIRLLTKNGPWWFLHQDLNRVKLAR